MENRNSIRAVARRIPFRCRLASITVVCVLCVLADAAAVAAAAAAAAATASATKAAVRASGGFTLELKSKPWEDAHTKIGASYRIGSVSSSCQYELGGPLEFKIGANSSGSWRHLQNSGSLAFSCANDMFTPKESWSHMFMSVGARIDRKAMPWQPELKLESSVRSYPGNPVRNYVEAALTAKAGRALAGKSKPSFKGELAFGHKEMPRQPKWTAHFWSSSVSVQWRPIPSAQSVKASASLSTKGRSYPKAPHKSYATRTAKAVAAWAASEQHSVDLAAAIAATARPDDPAKSRTTADASAKWIWNISVAPASAPQAGALRAGGMKSKKLTLTSRITAGSTLKPNVSTDNMALRAGASSGLVWELSEAVKLSATVEAGWSRSAWGDDDVDDEEKDDDGDDGDDGEDEALPVLDAGASEQAVASEGKSTYRLTLSASVGRGSGVTLSGKVAAARTDELKQGGWQAGAWAPSLELKASYKF